MHGVAMNTAGQWSKYSYYLLFAGSFKVSFDSSDEPRGYVHGIIQKGKPLGRHAHAVMENA